MQQHNSIIAPRGTYILVAILFNVERVLAGVWLVGFLKWRFYFARFLSIVYEFWLMCSVFSVVRSRKFQHRVQRSYTLRVLAAELALKAHCAFNLEQAHAPNCLRSTNVSVLYAISTQRLQSTTAKLHKHTSNRFVRKISAIILTGV
ncbi:hypothetical protein HMPREF3208_01432 [Gardnerella vaginalis]|uniref:Uncharacterized protein n=1 Tax=Gardnerella vaginalis TaxID=2702 RepID=A0A133NNJ2_GARVA|nr:hypothetical protein HMPREF3208_01432 [Gardnerella vaginalis]